MNTQTAIYSDDGIRLCHLDTLYLHPMNPRQNGDDDDTRAMAQSIAVNGLMQNLSGYADPNRPGEIGIVAGGRRLSALKHLVRQGSGMMDSREPDIDAIPVQITDDPMLARSWAGTESATQKPLHPADEIKAFAAMADMGSSVDMIARAFAQTVAHVRRRLALAALIPEALDALRAGHISLDVAKALTLARDASHQLEALTTARAGNWNADRVRNSLTGDAVATTDRRAVFVGTEAYLAAGGTIEEDLFADCGWMQDAALLDDLFARELDTRAEALRADQGWQWVKTYTDRWPSYGELQKFDQLHRTPIDLPEADAEELEELEELGHAGLSDEGRARLTELRTRTRGDFTDEQRESGGIVVLVNRNGELEIEGAYTERGKSAGKSGTTAAAKKPDLTQAGAEDLRRIGLLAMQTALVDKTDLVLDLFAWQIARGAPSYSSPFAISLTDTNIIPDAEGAWHADERLTQASNQTEFPDRDADPVAEFAAFRELGKKHRNQVLNRHITRTLQNPALTPVVAQLLPALVEIDIRRIWTPDVPTYFSRLSAPAMETLWAELLDLGKDDDRRGEFARLKKAEKARELAALFSDASVQEAHGLSRDQVAIIDTWLPPELRAAD